MTERCTATSESVPEYDSALAPQRPAAIPPEGCEQGLAVVLAGMPRSGTSLIASYLHHCGIAMGPRMLGALFNNPRGHFEDLDFLEFHKRLMQGRSPLSNRSNWNVSPTRRAEAEAIVLERKRQYSRWGWKDPRTTLFLDFWSTLLPDAKFVLLYRDPYENIRSEFKITHAYHVYLAPWLVPAAWLRYNVRCIDFHLRNPARSALVCINGFTRAHEKSRKVLGSWLGFDFAQPFTDLYQPAEMGRSSPRKKRPLLELHMRATRTVYGHRLDELYQRLDSLALVPSGGP